MNVSEINERRFGDSIIEETYSNTFVEVYRCMPKLNKLYTKSTKKRCNGPYFLFANIAQNLHHIEMRKIGTFAIGSNFIPFKEFVEESVILDAIT